jgi:hypothetical protein
MRVLARLATALAAASFSTSVVAQPYGLHEWNNFWTPIGNFDASFDSDNIRVGSYAAFVHINVHKPDYYYDAKYEKHEFDSLLISVAQVYDKEQFKKGRGSYWQVWSYWSINCTDNTLRETQANFYNKPQFADLAADELWTEKADDPDSWDKKYFKPIEPDTVGSAIAKIGCSSPVKQSTLE